MSEPITLPACEESQVSELQRLLRLETAALLGADGERIELPPSIHKVLRAAVHHISQGRTVTLVPEEQLVTTQQAANLLGMSRPHLIKLLESHRLPHHRNGSHRRLYLRDVRQFARERDAARHAALNRLAKEALDSGFYDAGGIPEGGNDE